MSAGERRASAGFPEAARTIRVAVEVLSWVNKFVGGPGTGEIVLPEEAGRGATVRAVLRQVTDRHPELGRALWDPDQPRELGDNIEVMVNNAVLGVSHELDSELADGDRIMLLGQYMGGSEASSAGPEPARRLPMPHRGVRGLVSLGALLVAGGVVAGAPSSARDLRVAQGTGVASPEVVARGRALFSDTKLSADGKWSCATCHPDNGHTDNKTYVGVTVVPDGDPNGRSTPTLWGAGTRGAYSWAGTAPSLEANIRGIIVNRMKGPEPSKDALAALAAYVRSLGYPPNPNLKADGTPSAEAPAAAKRGHELFMTRAGCNTCHQPPTYDKKDVEDVFSGGKFKTPSLRAVSRTGPYFHDGRYKTLEEAVRAMWDYVQKAGTSEKLTDQDIRDIVEFLKIL